jgi:hypothetical protein
MFSPTKTNETRMKHAADGGTQLPQHELHVAVLSLWLLTSCPRAVAKE